MTVAVPLGVSSLVENTLRYKCRTAPKSYIHNQNQSNLEYFSMPSHNGFMHTFINFGTTFQATKQDLPYLKGMQMCSVICEEPLIAKWTEV